MSFQIFCPKNLLSKEFFLYFSSLQRYDITFSYLFLNLINSLSHLFSRCLHEIKVLLPFFLFIPGIINSPSFWSTKSVTRTHLSKYSCEITSVASGYGSSTEQSLVKGCCETEWALYISLTCHTAYMTIW